MGFMYSFDMSKEIAHFKRLPENIQSSAERNVVDVIYESFVVPGDQDYLMSRLLAQKGLPRGFYWAAAQAIEKYLKAFLLIRGVSVKNKSHGINNLFKEAIKIDTSLAHFNILPHPIIQVENSVSQHLKTFVRSDFINDIAKHGCPDNRYNAFGVEYNIGHLFAMDSLAFQLRREIGVKSIHESFKRLSPDLILIFEKNNPFFHSEKDQPPIKIPSTETPIQFSCSVTTLDFLTKHRSKPGYNEALRWLNVKMQLPKTISDLYKMPPITR
jgi:HEPN domain